MTITDLDWIMAIAIMFGLALMMTYLTYKDTETFFIWLTIFSGFTVWSGLLPLWVLVLCLITLILIIANTTYKKRGI